LIEQGADIESKNYCDRTPLSLAAEMGNVSVVKLLSHVSRVDVNSQSGPSYESRRSPLSYAAENGHEAVADLLIAHKDIMIDLEDCRGKTPLMYAVPAVNSSTACTLIRGGENVNKVDFERKVSYTILLSTPIPN
jgi:ankyrin repeat protein